MTPSPRRRLAWKILGALIGSVLLLGAAGAIWTSIVADRRTVAMEQDLAAMRGEIEKNAPLRSPRRGEQLQGNAWDDHTQALAAIPRSMRNQVFSVFNNNETLSPEDWGKLLASGESAVDHLRRGLRRQPGGYPYVWEDGVTGKSPSLVDCHTLAMFAAILARRSLREGKPREAAERLTEICRFAQDLSTRAPWVHSMIARSMDDLAFFEIREVVKSKGLSRDDLEAIDRDLEQLAREWPDLEVSAVVEVMMRGYELLKPRSVRHPEWCVSVADAWRFGFSPRLVEVDAFEELRAIARELEGIGRRPWSEARDISRTLENRMLENRNPLVRGVFLWKASSFETDRELRANLQLLRAAVRFRATGEAAALDDPFGRKLRMAGQGDRLKVWSVGPDGVDDGGVGDWRRSMGKDIVLEVNR